MFKTMVLPHISVPCIGLGTYRLTGNDGIKVMEAAIDYGYRHLDTARFYENEPEVGTALSNATVDRSELFVTTKIWPTEFSKLVQKTENSLKNLKVDYIDLLLLHWPASDEENQQGLDLLNEVLHRGYVKYVGVSNFTLDQVKDAISRAPIVCNQVEYHPLLSQSAMLDLLRRNNLFLTAYRPLAKGEIVENPLLAEIAEQYDATPAQVALRWLIQQKNVVAIPKSSALNRMKENFGAHDFELTEYDMARIFAIQKNDRSNNPEWAPKWD